MIVEKSHYSTRDNEAPITKRRIRFMLRVEPI